MSYHRGDVVWGPDSFKSGENPRPWLILNNDVHPFGDEEYVTVTLPTTPHDDGVPIDESDWVEGGIPSRVTRHPGRLPRRNTLRYSGDRGDSKNLSFGLPSMR